MAKAPEGPKVSDKQIEKKIEIKEIKPEKFEKHEKIEIKEHKPEKFEKHEFKEHKIEKFEKIEKHEHKELKIEKIEHKEISKLEHGEKHIPKEKDGKELVENPGDIYDPIRDLGVAKEHLALLEDAAKRMRHFIETAERPDMGKGALNNEPGKSS